MYIQKWLVFVIDKQNIHVQNKYLRRVASYITIHYDFPDNGNLGKYFKFIDYLAEVKIIIDSLVRYNPISSISLM